MQLHGLRVGNEVFVVHEAGGVREQIANADVAAVLGKAGQHIDHAVVEMQLPVLHEKQDGHRGERLGERREPVVGVHGCRSVRLEVGAPERSHVDRVAPAQNDHAGAGDVRMVVRSEKGVDCMRGGVGHGRCGGMAARGRPGAPAGGERENGQRSEA